MMRARFATGCRAALVLAASSMFAGGAHAGYFCAGPVSNLSLDIGSGDVLVTVGEMQSVRLCSLSSVQNNVSVDVCKSTYSLLETAVTAGRPTKVYYNAPAQVACSAIPSWQYLSGFYFLTMDH